MQFRLRTLLIVLALGPVVLAGAWLVWGETHSAEVPRLSYSSEGRGGLLDNIETVSPLP